MDFQSILKQALCLTLLTTFTYAQPEAEDKAHGEASFPTEDLPARNELTIREIILQGGLGQGEESPLRQQLQAEFVNQPITVEVIQKIERQILAYYRGQGHDLVIVKVPEQEISRGVVRFEVDESRIGKVSYKGTSWKLDLQTGQILDKNDLLNDVAWLNRNPFHYTTVVLSPGSSNGTTDVEIVTKDRFPCRFYAGADNTGTTPIGEERLFAGLNWGNALGIDDLLTLQYTTSTDFHRYNSYYLNYTSFLPWKHTLSLYGAYALIHPTITHFRHEGKNAQASLRYGIPFKPLYKPFSHELTWGFDYKHFNNNLFFESEITPFITQAVTVTQFYLSYILKDSLGNHDLTFKTELLASPFVHAHYRDLRPHSHSQYLYAKMALGDIYKLPKQFEINWLLRGEVATGALLPSEQFGLGGYDTVRGYEEQAFPADNAICANLEIHSPSISFFKKDSLYFLAFVDYGFGHDYNVLEGLPSTQHLWGTGPGLRYKIGTYLSARLDYGFQLNPIFQDDHFGRWHFSVALSY